VDNDENLLKEFWSTIRRGLRGFAARQAKEDFL
jgi:hypothetical protein